MSARLIREFLIDLTVFLVVAIATSIVGYFAYLVLPYFLFTTGCMVLTAVILGIAIQRWVWTKRVEAHREEILHQAEVEAPGEWAEQW